MERTCPKCRRAYTEHPAISRMDNKTEICPGCGMMEALEAAWLVSDRCDMFWCVEMGCDSYNTGYKCNQCEKNGRCEHCVLISADKTRRPESCIELDRGLRYGDWREEYE